MLKFLPARVIAIEGKPRGEAGAVGQQRSQRHVFAILARAIRESTLPIGSSSASAPRSTSRITRLVVAITFVSDARSKIVSVLRRRRVGIVVERAERLLPQHAAARADLDDGGRKGALVDAALHDVGGAGEVDHGAKASFATVSTYRAVEVVVGKQDDAFGAELPRRADVLDRGRRRELKRADAGPHGPAARKLLDVRNLRAEDAGIGRVRHRADRVEQARLEPAAPVLKAAVAASFASGNTAAVSIARGRRALTVDADSRHQRGEPRRRNSCQRCGNISV